MKKIIFLMVTLLMTSCGMLPPHVPVTIKERLAVGSILKLNRAIEIPQDRSFIYIANGKVAPIKNFNTVDIYSPYCMFYLKDEVSQVHTINPDRFKVTKITEWEGYYSSGDLLKYAYASNQYTGLVKTGLVKAGLERENNMDIIMYATILRLHSSMQPEVKEIVCGHWEEKSLVEPLTLDELKSALGDLITIEGNVI